MKPPHAIGVPRTQNSTNVENFDPPKTPFFFGISDPPGPQILINPGPPISKRKRDPPRDPDFGVSPPEPRFRGTPPDPRFRGTPENPDFGDPPETPDFGVPPPEPRFRGTPPGTPDFGDPPPDRGGPPPPPETPISGTPPGGGTPRTPIPGYPPRPPILGYPPRPGVYLSFLCPRVPKKPCFCNTPCRGKFPDGGTPPTGGGTPHPFLRGPPPKCVISQIGVGRGGPPRLYIYSYIGYIAIYIGYRGVC